MAQQIISPTPNAQDYKMEVGGSPWITHDSFANFLHVV